jgi:hypothetical protein
MRLARFSIWILLAGLVCVPTSRAGVLNGHPNAFNDGFAWSGSTPFVSGTLQGFVDWAVFAPGQFPFAGYVPTPGQATYAYQVFVQGSAPLSALSVALTDPASNAGSFASVPGDAPTSATITPASSVDWTFAGILPGGNSRGLAFSSPKRPQNLFGVVVDTGQSSFVVPLPSPGSVDIPEPASALALVAFGGLVVTRRARRGA